VTDDLDRQGRIGPCWISRPKRNRRKASPDQGGRDSRPLASAIAIDLASPRMERTRSPFRNPCRIGSGAKLTSGLERCYDGNGQACSGQPSVQRSTRILAESSRREYWTCHPLPPDSLRVRQRAGHRPRSPDLLHGGPRSLASAIAATLLSSTAMFCAIIESSNGDGQRRRVSRPCPSAAQELAEVSMSIDPMMRRRRLY